MHLKIYDKVQGFNDFWFWLVIDLNFYYISCHTKEREKETWNFELSEKCTDLSAHEKD